MAYEVKVSWQKQEGENFIDNKYNRTHTWSFDGGIDITASASPHIVPVPMSNENAVDPEEAFVSAVSSCHMLLFLSLAASRKLLVESYEDNAVGVLGKNGEGKTAMTRITLHPKVVFGKMENVSSEEVIQIHEEAHHRCFIANSVRTLIDISTVGS
jgi:organic hydroperoxide reductase OsmC/OhrA